MKYDLLACQGNGGIGEIVLPTSISHTSAFLQKFTWLLTTCCSILYRITGVTWLELHTDTNLKKWIRNIITPRYRISQLNYAATVSDQDLKLNVKAHVLVQEVCTVPSQPFDLKHFDRCTSVRVCTCPRCVCVVAVVCVLFFCVCEWVYACVFAFVCCVYSVAWERECVCLLYAWWIHASTRTRRCVCVVHLPMFFMCCVTACSSSVYRYVRFILLSVFQSFFATCNTYSMMWYIWERNDD